MITPRMTPYAKQEEARTFARSRAHSYGLLMEQGTGKTMVTILDCSERHQAGALSGALVAAPNGVHTNWVRRQLPKQMPQEVEWIAAQYNSGGSQREKKEIEKLFAAENSQRLKWLAIGWDALHTSGGFELAGRFLRHCNGKAAGIADESQRIKNNKSLRYKALVKLRPMIALRIILSGTPIVRSPWDAFTQFMYMDTRILGTTSYTAFRAEYAELLPPGHGLLRHIGNRIAPEVEARYAHIADPATRKALVEKELARRAPQIVARDEETGLPKWRNLEKLEALIAPHVFRCLLDECADIPKIVDHELVFEMTPAQREIYDRAENELRIMVEEDRVMPLVKIAALVKCSQIVSGYFIVPGTQEPKLIMPLEKNPKLIAVGEALESKIEAGRSVIVWARFQEEISHLRWLFQKRGWKHVEYHGKIGSKRVRQEAVDSFERAEAQIFLSQQQAGGTGLTLIAEESDADAMDTIYYSNTSGGEDRWQSRMRMRRLGQTKKLNSTDVIAAGTIDEDIVANLLNKEEIASVVTGDKTRARRTLQREWLARVGG